MNKYIVTVTRISHSMREIEVEADSEEEAKENAIDIAGDYEYSERDAEYEVDYVKEKE